MKKKLCKFLILAFFLSLAGCFAIHGPNKAQQAEQMLRQKDYVKAIDLYQQHIEERLAVQDRPEWENPYFYLILIGDVQLGTGEIDAALKTFLAADEKGVDKYLVSDRIRAVARHYEQEKNYRAAIDLLEKNKDRDQILFNAMLDRVSKALTASEKIN